MNQQGSPRSILLSIIAVVIVALVLLFAFWPFRKGGRSGDEAQATVQRTASPEEPAGASDASGQPDTLRAPLVVQTAAAVASSTAGMVLSASEALAVPGNLDSDGDGLMDTEEDRNGNGIRDFNETDPHHRDTDGDRWWDGIEVKLLQSDPLDPTDPGSLEDKDNDWLPASIDPDDNRIDTDDDRIADGFEALVYDLPAASDPARKPPLGDVNSDGHVSNLDALAVQGVFLRVLPMQRYRMENADANWDQSISNVDSLALHAFFMVATPVLPAM